MHFPRRSLVLVLPALALATGAVAAPAQSGQVMVGGAAVTGLETRLQELSAGLPADQRQLLSDLLRRAAGAPADDPEGTTVRPTFFGPGGRGIIVQGGREQIVVQGGRAAGGQGGAVVAPRPNDPNAPRPGNGAVAIGPKQDDPRAPRTGAVAIGPKQDDPRSPQGALRTRLTELSASLSGPERAVLDWMLHRAAVSPGTPGGLTPGRTPSLAQALGIVPLAIGPKQDDPAPPPPADTRWVLRF